jgi:TPR repeat protein
LLADEGNSKAQHNYALVLLQGDGFPKSKPLAAHYFKLSMDQQCSESQQCDALMLSQGDGIETNQHSQFIISNYQEIKKM